MVMKNIEGLTNTELFSELFKQLDEIKQELVQIRQGDSSLNKQILNFEETTKYLNVSHSHLYKLTSQKKIPHYKPNGKRIYFDKKMLEDWLRNNYQYTQDDIEKEARDYIQKNPLKF